MTAADVIRILLELDQQVISPRPSAWGEAAEIVWDLCCNVSTGLPCHCELGDFGPIDFSVIHEPPPRKLRQPLVDAIQEESTTKGERKP